MTLDRRRFLQLTAVGMVAGLTSSACTGDYVDDARRPGLLEMLGAARVWEIGSSYRKAVPSENSEAVLRAAIAGSRPKTRSLSSIWSDPIERQVQEDFATGRTVIVNGWVLSATEARQCALFSLTPA
jgi:hypothetical protein